MAARIPAGLKLLVAISAVLLYQSFSVQGQKAASCLERLSYDCRNCKKPQLFKECRRYCLSFCAEEEAEGSPDVAVSEEIEDQSELEPIDPATTTTSTTTTTEKPSRPRPQQRRPRPLGRRPFRPGSGGGRPGPWSRVRGRPRNRQRSSLPSVGSASAFAQKPHRPPPRPRTTPKPYVRPRPVPQERPSPPKRPLTLRPAGSKPAPRPSPGGHSLNLQGLSPEVIKQLQELGFLTGNKLTLPQQKKMTPNEKFLKCCQEDSRIPSGCYYLCQFENINIKNLIGAYIFRTCPPTVGYPILQCGSSKKDHRQCCLQQGAPAECMTYCHPSSNPPIGGGQSFSCLNVVNPLKACFKHHMLYNDP